MVWVPWKPFKCSAQICKPAACVAWARGERLSPSPVLERSSQLDHPGVAEVWVGVGCRPAMLRMLGPWWETPLSVG